MLVYKKRLYFVPCCSLSLSQPT